MINDKQIEQLTEILVKRIEQANTLFLKSIGSKLKKIKQLSPTQAHQLVQIMKYGGEYDEIAKEISGITKLNLKEIDEIFYQFAKKDQEFARQFYEYRKKKFIPIAENEELKNQVQAFANITKNKMQEFSRSKALGYTVRDKNGHRIFKGLKQVYDDVLDEAILNISQGKETFDSAMRRTIKDLAINGLKTVDYEGRSVRLDSTVRMHMQDALRSLHNELQQQFGKEFDSDGVEISVHLNPAPDHALVQGRQFTNEEFNKFQNDEEAVSYDGIVFPPEYEGHDRRSISQYNCYHYIFSIVLGVNNPEYTDKELADMNHKNEQGFELDGKHYTLYEGTQVQRKIETEIRRQKDLQILSLEAGEEDTVQFAQRNISHLTQKYNELCNASGLPRKNNRLRVSGYKRVAKPKDE